MPVPYTLDAVEKIRETARAGQSVDALRLELEWDRTFFDRVCQRHGIDFAPIRQYSDPPVWRPRTTAQRPAPKIERQTFAAPSEPRQPRHALVTYHLRSETATRLQQAVARGGFNRSLLAGRILTEAVSVGAHRSCPIVIGARPIMFSTAIQPYIFDQLCTQTSRHGSMSALCAAIIDLHFRDAP